jgi:hypothetical protein
MSAHPHIVLPQLLSVAYGGCFCRLVRVIMDLRVFQQRQTPCMHAKRSFDPHSLLRRCDVLQIKLHERGPSGPAVLCTPDSAPGSPEASAAPTDAAAAPSERRPRCVSQRTRAVGRPREGGSQAASLSPPGTARPPVRHWAPHATPTAQHRAAWSRPSRRQSSSLEGMANLRPGALGAPKRKLSRRASWTARTCE